MGGTDRSDNIQCGLVPTFADRAFDRTTFSALSRAVSVALEKFEVSD